MSKSKAKISVIIPTRERPKDLFNCLSGLLDQTILPEEIIVVDNSEEQSARLILNKLRSFTNIDGKIDIKYFWESRKGATFSRNRGIKNSTNDTVAFIDDDCVPKNNWVEEIIYWSNNYRGKRFFVQGKNLNGRPDNVYSCVEHFEAERYFSSMSYKSRGGIIYFNTLDTKNFFFRKSDFPKIPLFDFRFWPNCEDMDFSYKIKNIGAKIIFNPKIIVSHYGRNNLIDYLKREFSKGQGSYIFHNKWFEKIENGVKIKKLFDKEIKYKRYKQKKKKKLKITEKRLINSILAEKNCFFNLYFRFLFYLSRLTIKLGYIFQRIKYKYAKVFSPYLF